MNRAAISLLLAGSVLLFCAADWPQFRGLPPGLALEAAPVTEWDGPSGKNIAWKTALPSRAPSSPIVVRDRVIVTSSDGPRQEAIRILCFDAATGQQLWERQFWATGRTACHPDSANAAPTPASDGQRIFAFYSSNDLVCLDLDGQLLWYRGLAYDYPKAGNDAGMASSPVVADATVVVQIESQGDAFAAGIDASTGETRWRLDRERVANWTSPALWQSREDGRSLVLLQSPNELVAVEPRSGKIVWQHKQACDAIPSPTLLAERAVFVGADRLVTLALEDNKPRMLWEDARLRSGAASPVVANERVYTVNRVGVLSAADLQTGKVHWQLRLPAGEYWGTPVVAGAQLYLVNREGEGVVVRLGDGEGEVISTNPLGDKVLASPAVAGNALYIRGAEALWKIAQE